MGSTGLFLIAATILHQLETCGKAVVERLIFNV